MSRLATPSDEELRQRKNQLGFQLAKAREDLKDAESRNDLRDYKLAEFHISMLQMEINSIDEKLHPYSAGIFDNKCHPAKHNWSKWEYFTDDGYRGRVCLECGEYDVDTLND